MLRASNLKLCQSIRHWQPSRLSRGWDVVYRAPPICLQRVGTWCTVPHQFVWTKLYLECLCFELWYSLIHQLKMEWQPYRLLCPHSLVLRLCRSANTGTQTETSVHCVHQRQLSAEGAQLSCLWCSLQLELQVDNPQSCLRVIFHFCILTLRELQISFRTFCMYSQKCAGVYIPEWFGLPDCPLWMRNSSGEYSPLLRRKGYTSALCAYLCAARNRQCLCVCVKSGIPRNTCAVHAHQSIPQIPMLAVNLTWFI